MKRAALVALVCLFLAIAAIGVTIFLVGLNVEGTAGGSTGNPAEVYAGAILLCVGLFGALIVLAVFGGNRFDDNDNVLT